MADVIHTTTQGLLSMWAAETTWGTAVAAATVQFGALEFNPGISIASKVISPRGVLLPTAIAQNEESVEISFDSDNATYQDMHVVLDAMASGPDLVSDVLASDIPSFSVTAGGITVEGAVVTDWAIKGDPSGVKFSGKMIGEAWANGEQTHVAVTQLTASPVLNQHVTISVGGITVCSSSVGLTYDWGLSVAGLWGGNRACGSKNLSTVTQRKIEALFNISVEKNATTMPLLTTNPYATKAVVITLTDGTNTIAFSFDVQLDTPEEFKDNDGVYGFGLKYKVLNKATKAITTTITACV